MLGRPGFIFADHPTGPVLGQVRLTLFFFAAVSIFAWLLPSALPAPAAGLLVALALALPAQAQRRSARAASAAASASPATARAARLLPLFGGLNPAQATQLLGAAQLKAIAASFASSAEASTFFSTKGFEYLRDNQPDTAAYRFNLAWLLNPQNAEAYRGLGVVASAQPTPDASIGLLAQGLALAPTSPLLLSDLGTSYLIRYGQAKKKKDLLAGLDLLQRATATDPTNAVAWQQLARGFYYQEKYAEAWAAVHKGQALSVGSLDFGLITDLLAKLPDPQGTFK